MTVRYTAIVKKIGNSHFIPLPKTTMLGEGIEVGDLIDVEIVINKKSSQIAKKE